MITTWLRLSIECDLQRLQADLQRLQSASWPQHINHHVHDGGWTALPLRAVNGNAENIVVAETATEKYRDTRWLQQCQYIPSLLEQLHCPLLSVRLMSLKAGDTIQRHADHALGFEDGCVRLHIPIQTHPDVTFEINDQPVHFSAGGCWYMNANLPHAVYNRSDQDRIHLVIDCEVNGWLEALFQDAGYQPDTSTPRYGSADITDDNALQIAEQLDALATETSRAMAAKIRRIYHSTAPC